MIRLNRLIGALLTLAVMTLVTPGARAELRVDITRGNLQPLPIAITDFFGEGPREREAGRDIASVISADLERSGLFKPIDKRAFHPGSGLAPGAAALRRLARDQRSGAGERCDHRSARWPAQGRVPPVGRIRRGADGRAAVPDAPENWRRVAHIIADAIYKRITGEDGYFDTRIVYVAESGPGHPAHQAPGDHGSGRREPPLPDRRPLARADAALLAARRRRSPISPTTTTRRGFTSSTSRPAGRKCSATFPGMTFAPRFSPSGEFRDHVAWPRTAIPTSTRWTCGHGKSKRLTSDPSIDTSPCYSPDAKRRSSSTPTAAAAQQIYVMNADGSGVRRISFGHGRYATPVWSPRGDLIAFTKQIQTASSTSASCGRTAAASVC